MGVKLPRILTLVVLLLLGWFAWSRLPGLRTKVGSTVEEYGGWTAEARAADPVGFLDFAEAKLVRDIETFKESRVSLGETRIHAESEMARNAKLLSAAEALADRFRGAYRGANGTWPIDVEGASYSEEQLVEQVETLLIERDTYARVVTIYGDVIVAAEAQQKELRTRIQTTEATLIEIRAQRELVRVQQATAETDELLGQVDELLSGNDAARDAIDDPVRSVEDLLAAPTPTNTEAPKALEFLEG